MVTYLCTILNKRNKLITKNPKFNEGAKNSVLKSKSK